METQLTTPVVPDVRSSVHSDKGKPWMKWVIALVLVALLASGATYLVLTSQSKQQPSYQQSTLTTTSQPTPTSLPSETSMKTNEMVNWKTYTYEKYGFKIKYPPDWTVSIGDETGLSPRALNLTSPKDSQGNFINFNIQRYDIDDHSFTYPPEITTTPNAIVDKVKAYKDEGYVRNPHGPSTQSVWMIKNNFVYRLNFQVFKKFNLSKYQEDIKPARFTPEEESFLDQILSTFTFD